ncbi:MAG: LAGLIDADG family homing endonuclease [bacterium]|nr:MAG: LAGLIDADG family homing endonuclease [bacterium]
MSPDYITGLTDGEGCFYIGIRLPKGPFKTVRVEPHFYIKLRGDNLPLLEEVRKTLKCGAIYYQNEKRINHSACYRYEVNNIKDLKEILVPFFEKFPLLGVKQKDFLIFKEVVSLVFQNKHKDPKVISKIIKLKSTMNNRTRWMR